MALVDPQVKEMLLVTIETTVRRLLLGSNIICESKELPTTASRFTFRRTTSRLASVLRGWWQLCESTNLLDNGIFHLATAVADLCTSIVIPEVLRRFIEFVEEEGRQLPNRARKDTNPHLNHQQHLPWARRCQDLLELRRILLILHIRLRRLRREAIRVLASKTAKEIPVIKGQDVHQDFLDDNADLLEFSSSSPSSSSSNPSAPSNLSPTPNEDNNNYPPAAVIWVDPEVARDGLLAGDSFEETDDAALNNKANYVREEEYQVLLRNSKFSIELGIVTAQLDQDYGSSDNGVIILPVSSSEELAAMLKRSKERKGTRDPFGTAASRGSLRVVVSVKPSTMYFSQPSYANGFKVSSPATIASAASLTPSFSPLAIVSPSLSLSIPLTGKRKSMISSSRGKKDLKRTLLWLSDGEVSSEQKLLFSRAKVEHISVVRMKSTSEFLSWMELEYSNRVKGEGADYLVEVRLAMVPNRSQDPGIPELGLLGGSDAGSSLALWMKRHENPWWRSLPVLVFCEKDAPCQCVTDAARWLYVTADLSEAADYCCMTNILPALEFEAFWDTSIPSETSPSPAFSTSFCTPFVGLIGMCDYQNDTEDARLLSPEAELAHEVKASLEALDKYGLKSVPILAYMGKGQSRGLGLAGKNTPSVRPTRDPNVLFNFVNMSIIAWIGPSGLTSSIPPSGLASVKKDKKTKKPTKSESGVAASTQTRWKSLLLPASDNPAAGLSTTELPHSFRNATNYVYYTAVGQKVALAQDQEPFLVLVDLKTGKSYEYVSDSWTGSPELKIDSLLSSPEKSKVRILTYDEVTIISDSKRWAQVFPNLPFLAGKSLPMQGLATRDYKGSYRLWKVSYLNWNSHPRYSMVASQWVEKPQTKYRWGIDQQYTLDLETFSLLHPHTDRSVTKLKYFSSSVRRESYSSTPPLVNVEQLVFYQHLIGMVFRERPHEVRVWDTRRFTLLPAGNWDFDRVVESPAEIFVLRHRFPVEHFSIGSSCLVTVTKETSTQNSTSSKDPSNKLIYFLVLWNLFGEQVTAIPLCEPVISIAINAVAVFVLLPRRVFCISAFTGERLGELEMTKEHLGCESSDWVSIHSPSLETLCFFSRNGRILRRDISPVVSKS